MISSLFGRFVTRWNSGFNTMFPLIYGSLPWPLNEVDGCITRHRHSFGDSTLASPLHANDFRLLFQEVERWS